MKMEKLIKKLYKKISYFSYGISVLKAAYSSTKKLINMFQFEKMISTIKFLIYAIIIVSVIVGLGMGIMIGIILI